MNKTKAGVILVLFSFLFYTLALPVMTIERAWALPVKQGSQGAEVKETQSRLQALGFLTGKIDGVFGPKTNAAVRAFQRKWKLAVDGIVGWWTMNSLRKSTPWISVPKQPTKQPARGVVLKPGTGATTPAKPNPTGNKTPVVIKPAPKPSVVVTKPKPPAGDPTDSNPPAGNPTDSTPLTGAPTDSKPPTDGQTDNKPTEDTQANKPADDGQGGATTPDNTGAKPEDNPSGTKPEDNPSGTKPEDNPSGLNLSGSNPSGSNQDNGSTTPGDQNVPPVSRGDDGLPSSIPTVAPGKMVLGFTAEDYIGDKASYNSVVNYGQNVDAIATFTYFVEGNGNLNLQTPVPRDTIKMAKTKGVRSLALIHNFQNGFNKEIARTLMKSATARQNLINQLLVILPKEGYDGINVDIEGIYPADSAAYINLLKELKTALQAKGYWLTVSIPAKAFHNPQDGWSGGYDYKAIGELADHVLLMTYDYSWMGGSSGPIAPLPWVEQVIKYAVSQMPAKKVLMGLATYGYDWSAPKSRALAYPNAVALANQYGATIKWNQEFQVPYFNYTDAQGIKHDVWFEDQRSAKAKLQLVTKYSLAGVGIWRLGFEDSLYWDVLKEYRAN